MQKLGLDLYVFIGIYNTEIRDNIIRIGLASKSPSIVEFISKHQKELELKSNHHFEKFKQRGLEIKKSGGISKDVEKYAPSILYWQEDFIAISYKEYSKDILSLLEQEKDIKTAKQIIWDLYNEEWASLTQAIIDLLQSHKK